MRSVKFKLETSCFKQLRPALKLPSEGLKRRRFDSKPWSASLVRRMSALKTQSAGLATQNSKSLTPPLSAAATYV